MTHQISNSKQYGGNHIIALVVVAMVALVGALGYFGYNAYTNQQSNSSEEKVADAQDYWASKCGAGYSLVKKQIKNYGVLRYFTRDSSVGTPNNCFILHKKGKQYGLASQMALLVNVNGQRVGIDQGNFKYFAGPIQYEKRTGPNQVEALGSIASGLGDADGSDVEKYRMAFTR